MILELGLICNVYLVYLLLRSNSNLPLAKATTASVAITINNLTKPSNTQSSPLSVTDSEGSNLRIKDTTNVLLPEQSNNGVAKASDSHNNQETRTDYHLTTRRLSKVLIGRVTNQVLISQQQYLSYWWYITDQLSHSYQSQGIGFHNESLFVGEGTAMATQRLELYQFDGLIQLSNNSLLFIIIINLFAFLSYQVCNNGLGTKLYMEGVVALTTTQERGGKISNPSGIQSGETSQIIQGNVIGIDQLLTSNNQILALISWEQINICIYSLISINNYNTKVLSNSIKYFIISAVSTTLFIQGITILYMETGSFNLTSINYLVNMESTSSSFTIREQGVFFIFCTILQKLGGAPLHFWAPDLYSSQPSNITQWLLIVPKLGNLQLLLTQLHTLTLPSVVVALSPILSTQNTTTIPLNLQVIVGILSMQVGSLSQQSQVKIKRFFAYSSICHVGFLLQCLSYNGYNTYIHYLIIYGQTTLNIFILINLYNNNNLSNLYQFHGLSLNSRSQSRETIASTMTLFIVFSLNLFSLAGMPPLAGFFAKLGIQGTILSDTAMGTYLITPGILVLLLFIQASIISAYNYLRLIVLQLNIVPSTSFALNIGTKNGRGTVSNFNQSTLNVKTTPTTSLATNTVTTTPQVGVSYMYDMQSVCTILLVFYTVILTV